MYLSDDRGPCVRNVSPWLLLVSTGLFGLIGIIVYAAEINSDDSSIVGTLIEKTLGWSFALCTLSACLAVVAVGLIGIGARMAKN